MKILRIAIKSPQFVFLLLFIANFGTATSSFSQGGGGGSQGGSRSAGSHVSLTRDLAKISYPKLDEAVAQKVQPKSVLLIEPRLFEKEGLYLWRDVEGIWQLRVVSERPLSVLGIVKSVGRLEMVDKSMQLARFEVQEANVLRFEGLVIGPRKENDHLLQFKVIGDFVEFDFLIDGQQNPENIYLGAGSVPPAHIPFRLENRPVVPPSQGSGRVRQPSGQVSDSQASSGRPNGSGGGSRD
jgi:hypothetical protein